DKNSLDTGTLGFSDIHNRADYKTQHQGGGISTGGSIGSQFAGNMTSALLAGGGNSGHAEGTTQSAVSEGTITIRDQASQKQDVADLSRDTEHASGSIGPIFDKEKEQRRLQEVQLTGEIGSQAADIARAQGEIAKQKAIKDPAALTAAEAKLKAEGNSSPTAEQIADQAGRTAMAAYGTGSDLQRGIQAATAALQGLAGGDIAGALAGASAPELANLIGHGSGLSDGAAVVAHAILGGAVAALQGNSAAAGAAGAAAGELAARAIAGMLYPGVTDLSTLTEAQKQTVSTLATVSAGMAGGLAGDSTASAVAGAQGGKNAVENNLLGGNEWTQGEKAREHGKDVLSCADNPSGEACQRGLAENKAYAGALATGGVALLPGTAQAMWGLGAGVNAGAQYAEDGKVNPVNSVVAGWINVASIGNGLWGTVGWNAAGGALTNQINGDNPLTGAITNGLGSAGGYWGGKLISSGTNAAGKWLTGGWDPKFNPDLLKYTEIKGQLGISKEMLPGKLPGNMGNIGASVISEGGGKGAEQVIKKIGDKNEK
ncbi:VENN motif pre-toxin domain-containing protein, partial [Klebsiella sp. HMSC25G12]